MDDFDDFPDDLLLAALESSEKQPKKPSQSTLVPSPATTTTTPITHPSTSPPITTSTHLAASFASPAASASALSFSSSATISNSALGVQQPVPQRLHPGPKSLSSTSASASASRAPSPSVKSSSTPTAIVQPKPQALAKPSVGSNIIVSLRQKGNPLLTFIKKCPWEYRPEIEADYILGVTTCALFLSLKYHRLHPEYVYKRIKALQGKYKLRVLLALVDITDHHDSLRELAKTSLVNNVTLICCWSAQEAAHYLETYKLSEHSTFDSIKGQQATNYMERIFNFVTAVPGLNRNEALSLIINFGSLKDGINADGDKLGMLGGWGDVKVKRWREIVEEPFHPRQKGKLEILGTQAVQQVRRVGSRSIAGGGLPIQKRVGPMKAPGYEPGKTKKGKEPETADGTSAQAKTTEPQLSRGIADALAKLRQP